MRLAVHQQPTAISCQETGRDFSSLAVKNFQMSPVFDKITSSCSSGSGSDDHPSIPLSKIFMPRDNFKSGKRLTEAQARLQAQEAFQVF